MIELNNLTKETVPREFLKKVAQSVLRFEKQRGAGLSIVLLEKKRMLELNRIYRKKDRAANVLSFPFDDAQGKPIPELGLGEVVLCPSEIRKNAKEYGISYKRAMAWMLVHGILHLIGYTHSQMASKEKSYRSRIS
ncbi:MAG: rRNA maturation RNase YbeY [Parcubacteria group bacterium]|nr:rRNA maturation RNase YbeY [Parcubacteria group bacterium]